MAGRRRSLVVILVLASILSLVPPSTGTTAGGMPLSTGWIPMESSADDAPRDGLVNARSPGSTPGIDATDVHTLHEQGVTGEGVKVGVIGSRFSADHEAIEEQVGDYRQFASDSRLLAQGASHDTGVAEIVAQTAPDSSLYLAGIGSRATPRTYEAAVQWLLDNEVDVIVDSASYFPPDARSMAEMNAIASRASDEGVVFVTSAGNYADRHWAGQVTTAQRPDAWVAFQNGTHYNLLGGPETKVSGRSSLRLYWSGDADFDLFVYRNAPGDDDPVVAKSTTTQSGDGDHAESVDVSLPSGNYYVAIRAVRVDESTTLDLFAANNDLSVTTSNGSMVAPATAAQVITVGATDAASGAPRSYSSAGPLLDLSAPDGTRTQAAGDLYGSSASAPVVAGTAALMVSQNGDLTPGQTEDILKQTATHSNGQLEMNASGAVAAATEAGALLRPVDSPDTSPSVKSEHADAERERTGEDGSETNATAATALTVPTTTTCAMGTELST
jgi:hypothetical protein